MSNGIHFPSSTSSASPNSNHSQPHSHLSQAHHHSHHHVTHAHHPPPPVHHPRQPGPHSDSYFSHGSHGNHGNHSHSQSHSHSQQQQPTASSNSNPIKHSKSLSSTSSSFTPSTNPNPNPSTNPNPNHPRSSMESNNSEDDRSDSLVTTKTAGNGASTRNHPGSINISNDYPHPDFEGPNDHNHNHNHHHHHQQQQHFPAGPPSPSSLTDTILGLHSTLYGGKRSPEEVEEMVARYYESDAVFVNPLLSAHGRAQIANQFCMAFALPGMDVTSELRDVICSDFEFDGTRAGIIDQTITVTFLPALFGSSPSSSQPTGGAHPTEYGGHGHGYDASEYGPPFADGSSTPGYALQSGIPLHGLGPTTPHPFANYSTTNSAYPFTHSNSHTPAASGFQKHGHHGGRMSQGQSPVTPYSVQAMWNQGPGSSSGNSRPHTPGWSSSIRPLSNSTGANAGTGLPPNAITNNPSQMITAEESGGGAASEVWTRPSMPEEALKPHWSAGGLGRRTFHGLLWSIFHPRQVLKELCSIKLHLMSRLEFNDAGLIVRHEDMWGLREAIEGIVPFASTVYAIERRVAGLLVHWTIGKGFKLSAALLRKALPGPDATAAEKSAYAIAQLEHEQTLRASNNANQFALENGNQVHEQYHSRQQERAGEAARALLSHRPPIPNAPGWYDGYHTISRSRAPSPSRHRWSTANSNAGGTSIGRRSRTQSTGCPPYSRTTSSDNLVGYGQSYHSNQASASMSNLPLSHTSNLTGSITATGESLPPDAGAKYRKKFNNSEREKDSQSQARSSAEFDAGLNLNFNFGGGEERGRALGPAQDRD